MKDEAQTRQQIIDGKLQDAGWNVNDITQVVEEFVVDVNRVNEPHVIYSNQFADYLLLEHWF